MKVIYNEILNKVGRIIKYNIRIPEDNSSVPLIIFSHGFKGFRNWSFIPYVCSKFSDSGFISLNLDFSMNGIIDDEKQIYDDSVFRKNTVSSEIADLICLIEYLKENRENAEYLKNWNSEIILVGHSLGGAVSILTSEKLNDVKGIVLWASISKLDRNTQRQKDLWKEIGFVEIEIPITGQKLHLDYTYIEDKDNNIGVDAIHKALLKMDTPILIIHPETDMTVSIKEAYEIKSTASKYKIRDLIVIPKSGHTFNCRHPFEGANAGLDIAIESTIKFVNSLYE
ncbi:alpha/beta hydrolase [Candidatus Kapaibacterium sp.]